MTEEYVQQLCRVALGTILASQNKEDSYPCTSIQSSAVDTLLEVLQKCKPMKMRENSLFYL